MNRHIEGNDGEAGAIQRLPEPSLDRSLLGKVTISTICFFNLIEVRAHL